MSQTAINAIAIFVFLMTFSSLAGSLLHISPVVPAVAAIGVLGFGTLDTLNWRGQGMTLLLDWFARVSPQYRTRVLHHEAGHFLVAHLQQIPITGYALSAWGAFQQGQVAKGGVALDWDAISSDLQRFSANPTTTEARSFLDHYAIFWMAGIAAEQIMDHEATGGAEDRQRLRLALQQFHYPSSELDAKERWALLQARTLIQEHQTAYEALVKAMQEQATVTECYQAIAPLSKH
jgi:hypothetical protein